MDWDDPMKVFGFDDEPDEAHYANGEVYDEHDDFYEPKDDVQPGASEPANHAEQPAVNTLHTPQLTAAQKEENIRKADMLRAKLIAQRQKTPSKAVSRSATPINPNLPTVPVQTKPEQTPQIKAIKEEDKQKVELPSDDGGLEALLNEGKALADAKTAALAAAQKAPFKLTATPNGDAGQEQHPKQPSAKETSTVQAPATQPDEQPKRPTNLSHSYYADLPAWLEMTGYHDVHFRNSKLSTYKERKALEEEADRIAKRLEKLKRDEQDAMQTLRMSTPNPTTTMAPPPLPAAMPVEKPMLQANGINGTKRARSPGPVQPDKRRRDDTGGFRIRGANEPSTDTRPPPFRRPRSPSPPGLERRIAYPDARRRSIDERKPGAAKSRDPSLERRQSYYRQETEPPYYDSYTPREAARPGFGNASRNNSISRNSQYRGSVPLDLRKGGQSPFRRA